MLIGGVLFGILPHEARHVCVSPRALAIVLCALEELFRGGAYFQKAKRREAVVLKFF